MNHLLEKLDLSAIHPLTHDNARAAFVSGDGESFAMAGHASRESFWCVISNARLLKERGIFEPALLEAITGCPGNNSHCTAASISYWVGTCREKFRAAGDPLPGVGPFTLYRGVAGHGRARRIKGISWTDDQDIACWFAWRYRMANPAVYAATVWADDIFAFTDQRNEREFLVIPDIVKRVKLSTSEIEAAYDRVEKAKEERNRQQPASLESATCTPTAAPEIIPISGGEEIRLEELVRKLKGLRLAA